jgi:hypothetical protein
LRLGPIPILDQFLLVQGSPLDDQSDSPGRQTPRQRRQSLNIEGRPVLSLFRMEMGWRVIVKEDFNDDPEKARNFRHGSFQAGLREKLRMLFRP